MRDPVPRFTVFDLKVYLILKCINQKATDKLRIQKQNSNSSRVCYLNFNS